MHAVAKQQLRDALSDENNLALKYDGTTKNGHHIVEVELLETKQKTYFVSWETAVGKSHQLYVNTNVSNLDSIKPNMLQQISNTMTDRVVSDMHCVQFKPLIESCFSWEAKESKQNWVWGCYVNTKVLENRYTNSSYILSLVTQRSREYWFQRTRE